MSFSPDQAPTLSQAAVQQSMEYSLQSLQRNFVDPIGEFTHDAVVARTMGLDILLEGGPGGGKSKLAEELARADGLSSARINGHPEVLPSDLIGYVAIDADGSETYVPGAAFTDLLYLDEINRNSPRTLNGILQALAERRVNAKINGSAKAFRLPATFSSVATQNPEMSIGTTKLGLAMNDRFAIGLTPPRAGVESLGSIQGSQVRSMLEQLDTSLSADASILTEDQGLIRPGQPLTDRQRFFMERKRAILWNTTVDPHTDRVRREFTERLVRNDRLIAPEPQRLNLDLLLLSVGNAAMRGGIVASQSDLNQFYLPASLHRVELRNIDFGAARENKIDIINDTYRSAHHAVTQFAVQNQQSTSRHSV